MSRSYSEVGLNEKARVFISKNAKRAPVIICKTCKRETGGKWIFRVYQVDEDVWYGESRELREYTLKDGRKVKEVLQGERWSSGPVAFFCLKIASKLMFKWTNKQMEDYL